MAVLDGTGQSYEILFVDDGSRDGSLDILRRLHAEHECIHVLKLTRNFGQSAATVAGIRMSQGEVIVTMDADLEQRPEDIPALLARLSEGYEVVHGVRSGQKRGLIRRLGSAFFQMLLRSMNIDTPNDVTSFRAFTRRTADMVLEYREATRVLVPVLAWTGAKAGFVQVQHMARADQRSGYSLAKLMNITLDMLFSVSYLPLRLSTVIGNILAVVSVVVGLVTIVLWAEGRIGVPGYTSLIVAITFLSGVQLIFVGIVGEYLARIYIAQKERPAYHIDWLDEVRVGQRGRE